MNSARTATAPGPVCPAGMPPDWTAAFEACGGMCCCTGQCGRDHTRTEGRCDRSYAPGWLNLHLIGAGLLLCATCHKRHQAARAAERATAAAKAAAARAAEQLSLFDC